MASIEDLIKAIKESVDLQEKVYAHACTLPDCYKETIAGRLEFLQDFEIGGLTAPTAATPTANSDAFDFHKLPANQKRALVADAYLPIYNADCALAEREKNACEAAAKQAADQEKNQKKNNFLIRSGIAGMVLGLGMLVSNAFVPRFSVDENYINYQMRAQRADVEAYKRTHGGRSPSWEKNDEQIRNEGTSDNNAWKHLLGALGLLGFVAGAGSAVYGYHKRR